MSEYGYWLSSEEHQPLELVRNAARAEEVGFSFAMISDHFHPWTEAQGSSPFVWTVLGGIAAATERIELLEEAIEVIRLLWQGGEQTHRGKHYTVDHAQLYTLPDEPIPIAVAAANPKAAELAGRAGGGLVSTEPNKETVELYEGSGGNGPRYGQVRICWAEDEEQAKRTVFELWRHSGLGGTINLELPRPSDFDAVAESVTLEMATEGVPCGADPAPVLEEIERWRRAGFDRIALHQVGPDQEGFFRFWEQELQPKLT